MKVRAVPTPREVLLADAANLSHYVLPRRQGRRLMSTHSHRTPKTTRDRAEEKHEAKLESVREQVQNGSLVIRQMTGEERRWYPPRPAQPRRSVGGELCASVSG